MDDSPESLPSVTCADCGSARLAWRVKRQRTSGNHASRLALAWCCRDCGSGWEEPLSHGAGPGAAAVQAA